MERVWRNAQHGRRSLGLHLLQISQDNRFTISPGQGPHCLADHLGCLSVGDDRPRRM